MSGLNPAILLVEDNDDDVFAMRRALKKTQLLNPLQVVTDGQQAVGYLSGSGQFGDREKYPLPAIIFLDLKLPYLDGFEVLTWIRQQPQLQSIVVVALTSSPEKRDQDRCSALGTKAYLIKPPTPDRLLQIFRSFVFHPSQTSPSQVENE